MTYSVGLVTEDEETDNLSNSNVNLNIYYIDNNR